MGHQMNQVLVGDCRDILKGIKSESVQCVVTSPPYWGLRDYGVDGQLGLEATPEEYTANMVQVFREVKRVLRSDGVCFLNLGDSYFSSTSPMNEYILREDLTEEEIHEATMGIRRYMPELWRDCWETQMQGSVCEMLSEEIQSGAPGKDERIMSGLLLPTPQKIYGQNQEEMGNKKSASHTKNGRKMRLLWRKGKNVSLSRSYQRKRQKRLSESWRSKRGMEKSDCGRLTKGEISPSLLELQFGIRFIWFLSSLKLDLSDIHHEVKIYFRKINTLKPKDLVGIPWRVAFALQADGWYLRSDIIWHKPNPMPESVTDRPTKSHEYIFLMTKNQKYYYDADAIREKSITNDPRRPYTSNGAWKVDGRPKEQQHGGEERTSGNPNERNKRSVWTIATQPYSKAHFATFPFDLVKPCILAGSARDACAECGTPYERQIEKELVPTAKAAKTFVVDERDRVADPNDQGSNRQKDGHKPGYINKITTLGFIKKCKCKTDKRKSSLVLDPFSGSGTVGAACAEYGRSYLGIELNPEYAEMRDHERTKLTFL